VEPITAIEAYGVRKYLRVWSAYSKGLLGAVEVTSEMSRQPMHRLFAVSVLIKGVDGVLETIGGILLMFVSPKALNSLVIFFIAHELSEHPDDWFATSLRHAVLNLSSDTKLFVSVYLVAHGLVKVFLVAGLLRKKLWAYPAALWFLGIFILYQLYRFSHTHSLGLLALSAFDLFVASLVWLEYRSQKQHVYNAR
jgi:uncharacterized membrane protein